MPHCKLLVRLLSRLGSWRSSFVDTAAQVQGALLRTKKHARSMRVSLPCCQLRREHSFKRANIMSSVVSIPSHILRARIVA